MTDSLFLKLPKFLFSYRNTPHSTAREPPLLLMFGRQLRSRLDLMKPSTSSAVTSKQSASSSNRSVRFHLFEECDSVLMRDYESLKKWIPGVIVKKTAQVSF